MGITNRKSLVIVLLSAGALTATSCTSDKKTPPANPGGEHVSSESIRAGEAGGTVEDTFTVSATVGDVDATTRRIWLVGPDGTRTSFKAPAEVRNFDQIRKGDKVSATITERLHVFVREDGGNTPPSASQSEALSTAAPGAKPGAMVAESYEVVARVESIDTAGRTAVLKFVGGQTRTVLVRPDVDLSRYKAGDSVVIRVTSALMVLVEKP